MTSPSRDFSLIHFARLCVVALCTTLMAACGGGAGTVGIASGNALFTSAPGAIAIAVGASGAVSYSIGGGTPVYTTTSSNASVAAVSISDSSLHIVGVAAGSAEIDVLDAKGASVKIDVTVGAGATSGSLLTMAPTAVTVGENSTDAIVFNIYGGTGPYRALSSDLTVSNVSIAGSTLTVGVGAVTGNRCINPVTSDGTYVIGGTYDVTVTVLDNLGASATSIMTIKDNGAGLNQGCP